MSTDQYFWREFALVVGGVALVAWDRDARGAHRQEGSHPPLLKSFSTASWPTGGSSKRGHRKTSASVTTSMCAPPGSLSTSRLRPDHCRDRLARRERARSPAGACSLFDLEERDVDQVKMLITYPDTKTAKDQIVPIRLQAKVSGMRPEPRLRSGPRGPRPPTGSQQSLIDAISSGRRLDAIFEESVAASA